MRERTFVAGRKPGWDRLEALLERVDRRGPRALAGEELEALALGWRAAAADLSAAQTRAYSPDLRGYLNRLTARGYTIVHAGAREPGAARRVARFFASEFPREFRRSGALIGAVAALFCAAWLLAWVVVAARPEAAYALLPAAEIPKIVRSLHDSNFGFDRALAPMMSSEIITNNIRVALIAFAGGVTLGVLTLWEVLDNGLMLGATGALFAHHGFGSDFYATVAPHGVIELTSIQIAAAGGLLLARAVVAPGRLRRIDAIAQSGRRAGTLVLGVAGMLVVAGLIEGFVTPQRTSEAFRFGFGAMTAVVLVAYFSLAGRGARTIVERA